jgi:hypothetical protein
MLAPIGVKTLATQFWAFQTESSYGAAAPYALLIIAVAVIPGALLGLWFDGGRDDPAADAHQAVELPPNTFLQSTETPSGMPTGLTR